MQLEFPCKSFIQYSAHKLKNKSTQNGHQDTDVATYHSGTKIMINASVGEIPSFCLPGSNLTHM